MIATEIANGNGHRLLDSHELAQAAPPAAVELPLDLIDPSPRNPRVRLVEVDDLAQSIKDFGLIQPLFVRRQEERYEILAGHRRYAAYAKLREYEPLEPRWRVIPAVVRTLDDERAYLSLITAQVHTAAWKPREESAALELLVAEGRSLDEIGQVLHRSKAHVSKRLRIYADAVLSAYVQTGRIPPGTAEELLVLVDADTRRDFADRAAAESWSPQDARAQVRALRVDRQLADLGRKTRELHELLSSLDRRRIPVDTTLDLWKLQALISAFGRGGPMIPTLEEAEAAAGVTETAKARAEARRVETQQRARSARRGQRQRR